MNKRILIGLCALLGIVVIAVAIYIIKEKYDGNNIVLVLYADTSLSESADKLDLEKLSTFARYYFPNLVSSTVVNVSAGSFKRPYTGALSITINGNPEETILIASTDIYKTQNLSVEQLEDAIYQNPHIIDAFKRVSVNDAFRKLLKSK